MGDSSPFTINSIIGSFTTMAPPKNNRNNSSGGRATPGGGGGNNARTGNTSKQDDRNNKEKEKDAKKNQQSGNGAVGTPLPSPPLSPTRSRIASGQVPPPETGTGSDEASGEKKPASNAQNAAAASAVGATGAASTTVTAPSTGDRNQAAAAISELLNGMRSTIGLVAQTFDNLQGTADHVAALGPAVDAHFQVQAVKAEVAHRMQAQETRMQEEKERLQEQLKAHIRETLRPLADKIVADVVKREVSERVKKQLSEKIPASLGDEIRERKLQVLQAKQRLHNSEARRHNALIRASGLDEPLQALLRPLDIPASTSGATSLPTPPATAPSTMSAASLRAQVGAAGRDSTRLSVNTNTTSARPTNSPRSAVATTTPGGTRIAPSQLVPPTPSPLFPPNLSTLVSLGPEEVKALVREYGLVSEDGGADDDDDNVPLAATRGGARGGKARPVSHMTNVSDAGQSWVEAGLDGTREDDLNKFMRYIGVLGSDSKCFPPRPSSPSATARPRASARGSRPAPAG
ncbi:hypothetical protein L226DRAFT_540918 [Lentinus tigrinus ALCF2SS1-7]|uniref:uncharacterized protein n=1 Tax=Lentinus tigrinus ALCF2SS1-7 TaxID=1328758 RepID=UPI001165FB3B|nr:hypothetical protein L226DRAFT_540918 [Lentinus tigrinus ALCF2SS1-7]